MFSSKTMNDGITDTESGTDSNEETETAGGPLSLEPIWKYRPSSDLRGLTASDDGLFVVMNVDSGLLVLDVTRSVFEWLWSRGETMSTGEEGRMSLSATRSAVRKALAEFDYWTATQALYAEKDEQPLPPMSSPVPYITPPDSTETVVETEAETERKTELETETETEPETDTETVGEPEVKPIIDTDL